VVAEPLRALMARAEGAGRLLPAADAAQGSGRAEHPVCGDEIEFDVHLRDGVVADLRWRASGCPATMAAACCAFEAVRGRTAPEAKQALSAALAAHGGLSPTERHAEALALSALAAALSAAAAVAPSEGR
jgi:NifU-like protein involved in Fe-S cluster formation